MEIIVMNTITASTALWYVRPRDCYLCENRILIVRTEGEKR